MPTHAVQSAIVPSVCVCVCVLVVARISDRQENKIKFSKYLARRVARSSENIAFWIACTRIPPMSEVPEIVYSSHLMLGATTRARALSAGEWISHSKRNEM